MDVRHRGEAVAGAHVAAVLGRSAPIAYVDEWAARRPGFLQGVFAARCGSEHLGGSRGGCCYFSRCDLTRFDLGGSHLHRLARGAYQLSSALYADRKK